MTFTQQQLREKIDGAGGGNPFAASWFESNGYELATQLLSALVRIEELEAKVSNVRGAITTLEKKPENQYKVVGVYESYSDYRQGREDMLAEVSAILELFKI